MLSLNELAAGVRACIDGGLEWPPTLPEFLTLCRPPRRENAAAYRAVPLLPAPPCDPEKARAAIDQARERLR